VTVKKFRGLAVQRIAARHHQDMGRCRPENSRRSGIQKDLWRGKPHPEFHCPRPIWSIHHEIRRRYRELPEIHRRHSLMRRDLVCSAILLGIAALYYLAATGIQQSTLETRSARAAFHGPGGASGHGGRSSSACVRSSPCRRRRGCEGSRAHWLRSIGMLAIGALYIPVATVARLLAALALLLLAVPLTNA